MNSLATVVLLIGAALAAPQIPYQSYKPAYAPVSGYVNPASYAAPAFVKPIAPVPASVAPYVAPAPVYAAQPQYSAQYVKPVAILRQSQDNNFDGTFSYDFETENGIASQASGFLKNAGTEAEAQVIQGVYSYTAPDGAPIVTKWYADETGFHAEGAHIPTAAPAVPYRAA